MGDGSTVKQMCGYAHGILLTRLDCYRSRSFSKLNRLPLAGGDRGWRLCLMLRKVSRSLSNLYDLICMTQYSSCQVNTYNVVGALY
jgi:hypothetical protein